MTSISALVLALVAWLLGRTWRLEVVGNEHVETLRRNGTPVVFAVWHGYMLVPLWHRRGEGVTLLVSGHRDAEYLARAASSWGYRVVRGSSTRRGIGGLKQVMEVLSRGCDVAFTPDGPRGPREVAKAGAMRAAVLGGGAVVPVGTDASSWWRLRSWDRFAVPRPFSRVRLVYGPPVTGHAVSQVPRTMGAVLTRHLDVVQQAARC
ncbi:MAG: lysophospholipid acyltransferase family protein [Gemmatimonadota bacterium]|nr:MAG: lysophospholipid acyltransferase family protein [Gemmatimonadota bacterium]